MSARERNVQHKIKCCSWVCVWLERGGGGGAGPLIKLLTARTPLCLPSLASLHQPRHNWGQLVQGHHQQSPSNKKSLDIANGPDEDIDKKHSKVSLQYPLLLQWMIIFISTGQQTNIYKIPAIVKQSWERNEDAGGQQMMTNANVVLFVKTILFIIYF